MLLYILMKILEKYVKQKLNQRILIILMLKEIDSIAG